MLMLDASKMMHHTPEAYYPPSKFTGAPFAMLRGLSREDPGFYGYSGLGLNTGSSTESDMINLANFGTDPIGSSILAIGGAVGRVIGLIENLLSIGSGRREADQITPIQNKMTTEVLAPAYAALDADYAGAKPMTCRETAYVYKSLLDGETSFLNMLHSTQWSDGRAAQQAEAYMRPYFENGESSAIQAFQRKTCGGAIQVPTSVTEPYHSPFTFLTSNMPLLIGALAAVFILPTLTKKGGAK